MTQLNRRKFLQATGAATVGVGLAGCSGGGGGDGGGEETETEAMATETETPTETATATESANYVEEEPDYGGWMEDANNYDRTVDATGSDTVTVKVGAGDGFAFGPAAVQVSSGTTVVWEWTGKGGDHNVVAQDDAFSSSLQSSQGATFEYTFEETGIHKYFCNPHKTAGMKGAVVVE
ncbi:MULTISPECIES: halocyanin domain-containing protein [unclassified Haloparvum]|uniref:halocyanin domain-containing protein n=1 Tax=Haloparvum sp. PAK95 TaxID=3418962 RepID=UPI003D2F0583